MKHLSVDDIEIIHIQIIDASGGSHGVRDRNRIESAVNSVHQTAFGTELYPSIFEKAAVLARGIVSDHPFLDGNKRTGIMSALVFLNLNGYDTSLLSSKELEDFAVQIAVEHLTVKQIASWLKKNSKKS